MAGFDTLTSGSGNDVFTVGIDPGVNTVQDFQRTVHQSRHHRGVESPVC